MQKKDISFPDRQACRDGMQCKPTAHGQVVGELGMAPEGDRRPPPNGSSEDREKSKVLKGAMKMRLGSKAKSFRGID